jgi:hypothetical protein
MPKAKKDDPNKWPSIKDAKGPKSTPVKYDPHMGLYAPTIKEAKNRETKIPKSRYYS